MTVDSTACFLKEEKKESYVLYACVDLLGVKLKWTIYSIWNISQYL
jgi:hypothetical protein